MSTIRYATLFLAALFLAAPTAFAQEDAATVDNRVQIKITESAKSQLVGQDALPKSINLSQAQTGVQALDQVAQEYNAANMERIFRPAGKHEARHVEWGLDRWYTVEYEADAAPETVANAYLATSGEIESASPVYEKTRDVLDIRRTSEAPDDEEPSLIPDDPEYETQWHYNNTSDNIGTPDADINLPAAHDIETGDSEVVVSVVDGGLDLDHPDFDGMLWTNEDEVPDNGEDDDNNGFVDDVHGYDHADNDGEPDASGSHGTHVAGTVAAKNGNGQYGAGIAGGDGSDGSGIRLMINKTFGTTNDGFAEAVTYAADNGAVVSQNSWGYTTEGSFEQAVLDAIDYFNANAGGPDAPMNGGIYVNAAGNSNDDGEWYPGFYDGAYAVSATNENDNRSAYSNYGDWVAVAAPGGGGTTSGCAGSTDDVQSTLVGSFGGLCGTSMAAPHVSGVIGLITSASPGIANSEVKSVLEDTGVDVGADEPIGPRIDAAAALQSLEDDSTPPAAVTDLAATGVSGNSIDLEWTAPGDDGDTGTATSYDLRYSTDGPIETESDFENANQVSGVPAPEPAGTVQNHTVDGLPYSTEVHFAIRAIDNVGNSGDLSNSPSETTEPGPAISVDPESFDVSLEVENSTDKTLTIFHDGEPGAAPLEWSAAIGAAPDEMTTPSDVAATTESGTGIGGSGVAATAESYDGEQNDVGQTSTTYQIDDGTTENALGFGGLGDDFDSMWLNAFQAVEGAGTITQISTAWGCAASACSAPVIPEGKEGLALVYDDPNNDGDPSDAELLTETTITVQDPGTDNFTTVDVAPTPVEGTFFVAVLLQNVDSDAFPMPMDESSTYQEASWAVATTNAGTFDKEDLSNNETLDTMQGLGFPANWLLRAEGSSGFLAIEPTEGSIEQGQSQDVTATFDATGVAPGIYEASINVTSNDPSQPVTTVPSTLEVTAGPPEIAVDPETLDFGDVFSGTSVTDSITVENTGGTALEVTDASLSGDDDFSMTDSTDEGGYVIPYEGSREIEIELAPSESGSLSATLEINTEQGVSATADIVGEGQPFVEIDPDELEEEIDLASGDSTATQTFTVTNQFDESLPFSVLIETLESEDINVYPDLVDEELVRWQQMQEMGPPEGEGSEAEPSLQAAPEGGELEGRRTLGELLDPVDVTGYGNELLASEVVSFDLGVPGDLTVLDSGFDSYAGNFTFANNEEIYWIDNADNTLKTYSLEDGTVNTVGELEPIGSDITWTDMETDPTTGTTYVTSGEANTNRLYELDVDNAELTHVGDFADGNLVVAFAIDDEGVGYAHDISDDAIWSVDTETADAEQIGATGINANFAQSMTWDGETGQLHMAALHNCTIFGCASGTLRHVDRETGNTTAIGSFPDGGSDEFGWMATPGQGIPWLSTNLEQGTLPAGATLTLEAQFDASDLIEGDYEAQITIASEELPGEPTESLPVSLSVDAEPVVFLSKNELEFDSTFVNGTTSPQMVTLRNDGAANMTINDVSIGDGFNVEPNPDSSFTLEPDEAKVFEVQFAPTEATEYSATLDFDGESVSGSVDLMGTGVPAPELAISPESFEKQAYVGQQQEHTLEITNAGESTLEYNAFSTTGDLLNEDFSGSTFPPEGWSRMGANNGENWTTPGQSSCGIWVPEDDAACFYWSPSTDGTQRLVTKQLNTQGQGELTVEFTHILDVFSSTPQFELRLESSSDGGETWTTVTTFPAEDMPTTEETIVVDNEDVGSDEFHLAWTFDGDSFDINTWGVLDVQIGTPDWLAVAPGSGELEAGETMEHTVSVDASGLAEGTLQASIAGSTNDPLAQSYQVPFTLNVIENLTVQPMPGDEVNPGETFTVPLHVESLDDLEVFSYEAELGYNPERVEAQEIITEGTLSEGLTLSSSIGDGTVSIAAAEGGEGPEGNGGPALFQIEGEGTLVSVQFEALPNHGTATMTMDEMIFNEGEPPASPKDDSVDVVPLYGDVDLDLSITSNDAVQTLNYAVGGADLIEAQLTHADVSGDESVGAFDASLILRRTVGTIGCFPVEPSCGDGTAMMASKSSDAKSDNTVASFSWGEVAQSKQASGEDGKVMSLPLVLDQADGAVHSISVTTEIDPDKVAVEDVKSQLPDSWRTAYNVSDDGTLEISMAGATSVEKSGNVAEILLREKESGTETEMSGQVAVNESSAQELASKSVVSIPDEFAISGTYPNPFSQTATLEMQLPEKASVTVEVYDVLGRKVKTAYNGEMQAGPSQKVRIEGSSLSTGTYFYRATVEMGDDSRTESGRMTVVR